MTTIYSPTLTVDVKSNYSLSSISGPTTRTVDEEGTYTCTLDYKGSGYSGQKLTLYVNGDSITSATTDSSGTVSFTIGFKSTGTDSLVVKYVSPDGTIDSPPLAVSVGPSHIRP
jgi:hypothetical protein